MEVGRGTLVDLKTSNTQPKDPFAFKHSFIKAPNHFVLLLLVLLLGGQTAEATGKPPPLRNPNGSDLGRRQQGMNNRGRLP